MSTDARSTPEQGGATIAAYYDWLSRYVRVLRLVGGARGDERFAMRKALSVPDAPQGQAADVHYADEAILAAVMLPPHPRVLDAGCGMGATIFRWHEHLGGTYRGLTLSEVQRRAASREAERRGIAAACRFELCSYDAPPSGPYDAVVAIESLIHSRDIVATIGALAPILAPGGIVAIVDDMPEPDAATKAPRELERFRTGRLIDEAAAAAVAH